MNAFRAQAALCAMLILSTAAIARAQSFESSLFNAGEPDDTGAT